MYTHHRYYVYIQLRYEIQARLKAVEVLDLASLATWVDTNVDPDVSALL